MLDAISDIRYSLEHDEEEFHGNTMEMLEQLPEDEIAAEIMAQALWNDYITE